MEGEKHTPPHPTPTSLLFTRPSLKKRKVDTKLSLRRTVGRSCASEGQFQPPPFHSHPEEKPGAQSSLEL